MGYSRSLKQFVKKGDKEGFLKIGANLVGSFSFIHVCLLSDVVDVLILQVHLFLVVRAICRGQQKGYG